MVKIYTREEPVLRKIAGIVPKDEIRSSKVKKTIADMKTALATQDDGAAICAPQIGVSQRMFVVAGRILAEISGKIGKTEAQPDMVVINPEIVKISKKTEWLDEGCLSLRYLYGKVKRATKIRIKARDETGKIFELGSSGLLAQIFQHEIDHLNGIIFTDKARDVRDIPPPERRTA